MRACDDREESDGRDLAASGRDRGGGARKLAAPRNRRPIEKPKTDKSSLTEDGGECGGVSGSLDWSGLKSQDIFIFVKVVRDDKALSREQ